MATELIINASLPEIRIALMENGEIQDLLIERATDKGIVGNIYKGRVTRVLPGMQAAFVDIGLEKAAFLYVDDVFVHSEVWEAEENVAPDVAERGETLAIAQRGPQIVSIQASSQELNQGAASEESTEQQGDDQVEDQGDDRDEDLSDDSDFDDEEDDDGDDDGDDEPQTPVSMSSPPESGDSGEGGGSGSGNDPEGTVRPDAPAGDQQAADGEGDGSRRRRHRRGSRGGRFRRKGRNDRDETGPEAVGQVPGQVPGQVQGNSEVHVDDSDESDDSWTSDRSAMSEGGTSRDQISREPVEQEGSIGRPELPVAVGSREGSIGVTPGVVVTGAAGAGDKRPEFKEQRSKDRRIRAKQSSKPARVQANIQDLLKEGQEVLVQVAKDPISTKGARLTCHISLPGRHLVCMPTIDHVGVSRRIERDDERRKLRDIVERSRPKGLGFIVRTASGRGQSEKRIKQDIDYLTHLWGEIREKSAASSAPALVYEDLNSVLRAIRDWVTDDIDKIVVDSRYHYNDIQRFVSHFMPSLRQKIELYAGEAPIFDAYGISTELTRALERKVWLKSGGYLVVDQAEALVAIDVNTGRFVGKKNLEDTILKTNLEAVQEIAYQLRLRNCGGIIILDLIDMEREENKQRVYKALEEALKKDRARPSILKISELGLIEMTRKRTRDTMVRALCESCSHCEGKGFVKSRQTVAYEVLREVERIGNEKDISKVLIQAHPDVIDLLAIDERETVDQLERRHRKPIYLQAVADFHLEKVEVTGDREKGDRVVPSTDREWGRDRDRGRNRNRGERGERGRERGGEKNRHPVPLDQPQSAEGPTPVENRLPVPRTEPLKRDDEHNDEDRLAFLRAQAAQDAALTRLGMAVPENAPNGISPIIPVQSGQAAVDPRRGRRGRRGGRNRRGGRGRRPGAGQDDGPSDGESGGSDSGQSDSGSSSAPPSLPPVTS